MSTEAHAADAPDEHGASAPDDPKVAIIAVTTLVTIALVVAIVLGVQQLFSMALHEQVEKVEMQPVDARLTALRATEKHRLTSYQWIDQSTGIVRIPLDQARELTLRDWAGRPGGTVAGTPGATTPRAPTTPAPAAPAAPGTAPAPAPAGTALTAPSPTPAK